MCFTADFAELSELRQFIHTVCMQGKGEVGTLCQQMQLCLNELFCNIVEHAYLKNSKGLVHVYAAHTSQGMIFDLYDTGITFDPQTIQEPTFSDVQERGYGMFIIKRISDALTYEPKIQVKREYNHWCIKKNYIKEKNP